MPSLTWFLAKRANALAPVRDKQFQQPAHPVLAGLYPESPELHRQHVLPGALRAITQEERAAWLREGLDDVAMARRVNARWAAVNSQRLRDYEHWRDTALRAHVEEHRLKAQVRAQAIALLERQLIQEADK
jgi:hypothetical protein